MAKKQQLLDVWIVESDTVYREVPYTVVVDWIQQGRLLAEDRVRKAGEGDWVALRKVRGLNVYFPRSEPVQIEDRAEALAPVELDFRWKKPRDDEDDDVDMIPLIDVSLVLLIFFMMVTPAIGAAAFIATPRTEHGVVYDDPKVVWIGVDYLEEDGKLRYYLGQGKESPAPEDSDLPSLEALLARLDKMIENSPRVEVTINAHEKVPSGDVRKLILQLETPARRSRILEVYTGVSEK
jgi:biopolymer transport protein ExbD